MGGVSVGVVNGELPGLATSSSSSGGGSVINGAAGIAGTSEGTFPVSGEKAGV